MSGDGRSADDANALADRVIDTLAGVVRDFGSKGFDTETMSAAALAEECAQWSEHLLLGAPAPVGNQGGARDNPGPGDPQSIPIDQRNWREVRQFLALRRRQESTSVTATTNGMRGLVTEMIDTLRHSIADDATRDEQVAASLGELAGCVESGSLDDVRSQMQATLEAVTGLLKERQERYDAQLSNMADHVQVLKSDLDAVRRMALTDPLTQVNNRGAFDELLTKQVDLALITGPAAVLLMVDIDHFKQVNDTHGHPAGDAVLKAVADALVRAFPRYTDFVARYGGEEFAILLAEVDPQAAGMLGDRALSALRGLTVDYEGKSIVITASVGAATLDKLDTAEKLIKRADAALYDAKAAGRDRLVVSGSQAG